MADGVDAGFQLILGGAERWHENDRVEHRAGQKAVAAGGETDFGAVAIGPRKFGSVGSANLNPCNEAEVADFVDEWNLAQTIEQVREDLDFRCEILEGLFAFEDFEIRERGGASEGISRIAVTVVEGLSLGDIPEEGGEDAFRRERRGERQVATGESFGEAEKIRNDRFVLAGEHFSGATKSRHHFIENQEHPGGVAFLAKFAEHSCWPEPHPGSALDEGFDHDSGDIAVVKTGERVEFGRGGNPGDGKFMASDSFVECSDAAEARCAKRVAMIGSIKRNKSRPLRVTLVLPKLHRHFHRGFDSCGSVVAEENPAQRVFGKKSREFGCQLNRGRVRGS